MEKKTPKSLSAHSSGSKRPLSIFIWHFRNREMKFCIIFVALISINLVRAWDIGNGYLPKSNYGLPEEEHTDNQQQMRPMSGSEGGDKAQENKQNQEAVVTTSDTEPQPNVFPVQYTAPHTPAVIEVPQMQKYDKVVIKKAKKNTSKNKKTKRHSSDSSSWDDSSDSSDSSSKSSTSSTQSGPNESSDETEEKSPPGPGKCKACQDIVKYDQVPHLTEVSYARDKDGCRIALINCGRNVRAVMKGVSASDDTIEILQDAEAFTAKTARCNSGGRWEIINSDGNPVEINKVKCWYKRWAVSHLVDQTHKSLKNLLDTDDTEIKAYKDGENVEKTEEKE
ncbi:hypothetical protein WR25_21662 isoform A [Diploscapter pachys]|uniref:Uncharacterized protein n=1 Tax=Diploscapter pachys TaxID=2018661 RepID=A0A2A2LC41_9BILA|nr:hypothetical protein WR25_21662 isoform A [Diploscapter pachys]